MAGLVTLLVRCRMRRLLQRAGIRRAEGHRAEPVSSWHQDLPESDDAWEAAGSGGSLRQADQLHGIAAA